jgi:hypothetical protein
MVMIIVMKMIKFLLFSNSTWKEELTFGGDGTGYIARMRDK